jgi:hypothetical protein
MQWGHSSFLFVEGEVEVENGSGGGNVADAFVIATQLSEFSMSIQNLQSIDRKHQQRL